MFPSHFAEMIHTFERATKKPTGDVLKSIRVSAASFATFSNELCGGRLWNVSQYRAGEWVVGFLCLIPIHIAITKENRFVPLKDGVYSPDLERSLLGADVNRIADSLSFGWYESLFQSYMASKVYLTLLVVASTILTNCSLSKWCLLWESSWLGKVLH
jgi:hypothetical protein